MLDIMTISFILIIGVLLLLTFIFWNIFKSPKKKIKFHHKSKLLGEIFFEQSD